MKDQYDIGLVCLLNNNYGNNLTYYALYKMLMNKGYSVLLIEKPLNTPWKTYYPKLSLFKNLPFAEDDLSKDYEDKITLKVLNSQCKIFVLGSDQLLRNPFILGLDYHTCMDWVRDDKYKIAYATSFGTDVFEGCDETRAKMAFYLKRFDALSVREESGKQILENQFGVIGECVLDPVFLCDSKVYHELAQKSSLIRNNPYVGAYILDPSSEKEEIIRILSQKVDCKNIYVYHDGEQDEQEVKNRWNLSFDENRYIEDWLSILKKVNYSSPIRSMVYVLLLSSIKIFMWFLKRMVGEE